MAPFSVAADGFDPRLPERSEQRCNGDPRPFHPRDPRPRRSSIRVDAEFVCARFGRRELHGIEGECEAGIGYIALLHVGSFGGRAHCYGRHLEPGGRVDPVCGEQLCGHLVERDHRLATANDHSRPPVGTREQFLPSHGLGDDSDRNVPRWIDR